jgi:hypothetical protein
MITERHRCSKSSAKSPLTNRSAVALGESNAVKVGMSKSGCPFSSTSPLSSAMGGKKLFIGLVDIGEVVDS